jgi:hypothetical protein
VTAAPIDAKVDAIGLAAIAFRLYEEGLRVN